MPTLTGDQRNYYYVLEAERAGIHKPILAALYQAQGRPPLSDEEKGLGISPANRVPLSSVDTFPEQVVYAANAIRSLTDSLITQGWKGDDLWDGENGRYTDRFLQTVATGYVPNVSQPTIARLEASDVKVLREAYLKDLQTDYTSAGLPQNLAYLDKALLSLIERLSDYYTGLPHQRDALLEAVRLWRELDTREAAIISVLPGTQILDASFDESRLDVPLKQFAQRLSLNYSGYPNQREALLRLTQLWRQLESREEAIASLKNNTSAEPGLKIVDPAVIAFVERIPQYYQGTGVQRNAITELIRLWRQLDSRASALTSLGIDPQVLSSSTTNPSRLASLAAQLDKELLDFVRRLPVEYKELDHQREALIRLVQLWRNLPTRDQSIRSLFEDLKRMDQAKRDSQDAPPKPGPIIIPKRPDKWTLKNIQLSASIIPDGSFTWAEATHGGTRMPPNQATLDAMIRIAKLAQRARDRIGRPCIITSWYRPPHINQAVGGARYSRHIIGDAIDFICEGLTGNQLYWSLDPWWPGGLGRYRSFPNLCHIDARGYRARWLN